MPEYKEGILIKDIPYGEKMYTQLGSRVLAVFSRRVDGWSVYVGAVPGQNHDLEWRNVAAHGDKQKEAIAIAIVQNLFHPPLDPTGVEYAH